jgi:late competence protein required for DNA uptake (superfamily II DNA/RNA helicase)
MKNKDEVRCTRCGNRNRSRMKVMWIEHLGRSGTDFAQVEFSCLSCLELNRCYFTGKWSNSKEI